MSKANYWPMYTIVGIILFVSVAFLYTYNQQEKISVNEDENNYLASNSATTNTNSTTTIATPVKVEDLTVEDPWETIYPNTKTMFVASTSVNVSVADTLSELIKGLSGTPYLPENVVKLFVFGGTGYHSIWMKEMNYSIDIIWADKEKNIVHIEKNVSPDTYPESFTPDTPALYVIETTAGFVEKKDIKLGDTITLPKNK